jgi:hypothetical protein
MTHPSVQNDIQIEGVCSAAIREEIADRLRIALAGESDRLPRHMKRLVEQMAAIDCQPPLVAPRLQPARPPSRMPIIDKQH